MGCLGCRIPGTIGKGEVRVMKGNSKRWLSAIVASLVMAVVVLAPASAEITVFADQSVALDELIASGESLVVGDKIFDDFSFLSQDFMSSDVLVTPVLDEYGYGLRFTGEWSAVGEETVGFVIQFTAEVAQESQQLISDVHLRYNGAYLGSGYSEVVETVLDFDTDAVLGQIMVNNPPPVLEAGFDLAEPTTKITVIKDVQIIGDDAGHRRLSENRASISFIDQTFSQIPEPGTVLLVAAGIFGLCLTGRRSHR